MQIKLQIGLVGKWISQILYHMLHSTCIKFLLVLLHSVPVPNSWQAAKQDSRWLCVMQEELPALKKNDSWELINLPAGKHVVRCK
jgi:hypothetical protein